MMRLGAGRLGLAMGLAAVLLPAAGAAPKNKGPQPATRLTLAQLGLPGVSERMVASGLSVLTVNFADSTHLLVTFSSRKLIPRVKDDPDNHQDRIVTAELVELPSGKILAQTDWHMHDQARYLWPMGHGRFVVRIGTSLSLLEPMATLKENEPLRRMSLPHQRGMPLGVTLSPDGQIISIVTELPPPKGAEVSGDQDTATQSKSEYAIDFYRLTGEGTEVSPLKIEGAGAMKAPIALVLPIDADGYLWAADDEKDRWTVSFNDFNGTSIEAGKIDSTCPPRMKMVSHSQYIAMTCRGTDEAPKLMALGLDGHEVWEENLSTLVESPVYAFAPVAGRFATSLLTTNVTGGTDGSALMAAESTAQEVRVYQTESGDLLLRVVCTPAFRVAENFDLSEDGRVLVVVRGDAIETYALPAPSKRDMEDLAEVEKFRPPASTGPVTMKRLAREEKKLESANAAEQAAVTAPMSSTTEAASTPSPVHAGETIVNGDGTTSRRRPTLLNPGEVPEFKDKTAAPQ